MKNKIIGAAALIDFLLMLGLIGKIENGGSLQVAFLVIPCFAFLFVCMLLISSDKK